MTEHSAFENCSFLWTLKIVHCPWCLHDNDDKDHKPDSDESWRNYSYFSYFTESWWLITHCNNNSFTNSSLEHVTIVAAFLNLHEYVILIAAMLLQMNSQLWFFVLPWIVYEQINYPGSGWSLCANKYFYTFCLTDVIASIAKNPSEGWGWIGNH